MWICCPPRKKQAPRKTQRLSLEGNMEFSAGKAVGESAPRL